MLSSLNIWLIITISFTTYFIVSWIYKKLGVLNLQHALLVRNGLRLLNMKHLLGIVLFGILFYIVLPDFRYLINIIEIPRLPLLVLFLILTFLCVFISNVSVKKIEFEAIGSNTYNLADAWIYFFIRFVFLLSYEFFFRGVLFYSFLELGNLSLAIAYTTILYLIIHLFDSKKEILGTLPFGIVLCLFTYVTDSVWYAFLMHLSLSAVYEISVFYYLTFKTSKP